LQRDNHATGKDFREDGKKISLRWLAFACVIFAAIACRHFYPTIRDPARYQYGNADAYLNTAILAWNNKSIDRGDFGELSEAPIYYPAKRVKFLSETLLGHMWLAYPAWKLTGSHIATYNITFIAEAFLTGIAVFLLLSSLTGARALSLAIAAVMLSGTMNAQLQIVALQWAVLAILFAIRLWRFSLWRDAIGLAASGTMAIYSCGYWGMFTPVVVAAVWTVLFIAKRKAPSFRWIIRVIVVIALTGAAVFPLMWNYAKVQQEYGLERKHASRFKPQLPRFDNIRFPFAKTETRPIFTVKQEKPETPGNPETVEDGEARKKELEKAIEKSKAERDRIPPGCFVLLIPWAAGFYLLIRKKASNAKLTWSLMITSMLCLWFALAGKSGPYYLLYQIPGFSGLRAAFRWMHLFYVLEAGIAALVLSSLLRSKPRLGAAATLLLLAFALLVSGPVESVIDTRLPKQECYEYLEQCEPGAVLSLPLPVHSTQYIFTVRSLYQLEHEHPMLLGYTGYRPPLQGEIFHRLTNAPITDELCNKLALTGVRYVVIDRLTGGSRRRAEEIRRLRVPEIIFDGGGQIVARLPVLPVISDRGKLLNVWRNDR